MFGISILTSAQSRVNSVPFSTFSAQNEANLKINTVTAVVALVLAVTAVVALVPAVTAEVALVLAVTAVFQQDRKCGYNVTTRSVGETTVAVAKQYYVLRPRVSAALPRQHATLLHRLRPTPSSAACPVLPCFFRIIS